MTNMLVDSNLFLFVYYKIIYMLMIKLKINEQYSFFQLLVSTAELSIFGITWELVFGIFGIIL